MSDEISECSICLSSIIEQINSCTTSCNHSFHATCLLQSAQVRSPPLCPLCRTNLLEGPTEYDPQQHCPRQVRQNIITAHETDQLTNEVSQNLNNVLTDIISRQDTSELLNNLSPHHIDNTSIPLTSDNIINIVIDAINQDEETYHQPTNLQRPPRHRHLNNIIYNILQHDSALLINNINNYYA